MMTIQRILCPVDFSEASRRALEQAAAIAGCWSSQLTVLHVYQAPSPFDVVPPGDDTVAEPELAPLRTALQVFVQQVASDVTVLSRLRHGTDARHAILTEIERSDSDLLVIGSHGRGGLEHFLLGSTAETLVRKAPCPVLVVPPFAHPPRDGRFRHILCGIDFSAASLRAFRYALHLASAGDSDVTLLHSIETPPELRERQIVAAFDVEAVRAAATAAARHRLETLSPGHDGPVVPIRAEVRVGCPHRQIVEVARQQHADLIVLGTHGRSVVDQWVFGSNTHAILRSAPCPVLTVRPE